MARRQHLSPRALRLQQDLGDDRNLIGRHVTATQFDALPVDRDSSWRLVSRLIANWFEPAALPKGIDTDEIRAAELGLGVTVPAALREWYLRYGNLPAVWNVQDYLLSPSELTVEDNRLLFARENQNVVQWSISVADLDREDPPVAVSDPDGERGFHAAASSVTEFAIQLLVLNAKFSDRELFRASGQIEDEVVAAIDAGLRRLPFPDLHWPPFPTRLYGDHSVIAEVHASTWLWVTARDREAFDAVLRIADEAGMEWDAVERPR